MALTPRDIAIVTAVAAHGFLTAELVALAFFPRSSGDPSSGSSRAQVRLRHLWDWGFLERIELPLPPSQGGRLPYLYVLGTRGVPLVMQHLDPDAPPVQRRRPDRMGGDLFLGHDHMIATFWANLAALLRRAAVTRWRWVSERDLRGRRLRVRDPYSNRWLPMLPDGLFEVEYSTGSVQCALLEVDMGTLTLRRFRRKVRAFEAYLREGHFSRDWGREDFEVVVLTRSQRRLEQLCQAARQEVDAERTPVTWRPAARTALPAGVAP